jgi:hypothetical protein
MSRHPNSTVHTLRLGNPFSGRRAKSNFLGSSLPIVRCGACGQPFDCRDLGQVFHHETPGHAPIPPQPVLAG